MILQRNPCKLGTDLMHLKKHGFCRDNSRENPKKPCTSLALERNDAAKACGIEIFRGATTEKVVGSTHQLLDVHQW